MTSTHDDIEQHARRLHDDAITIDGCAPVLVQDITEWKRFYDAGTTAILLTVTYTDDVAGTVAKISKIQQLVRANPDKLSVITSAEDLVEVKRAGKLGFILQFQNARQLNRDIGMVDIYSQLGVREIQLTYNYRNDLGDGCLEPENAGLSKFGRDAVARMNELGTLVDLSHTGERTTLEAMQCSTRPDVFSHANAKAIHDHPRNLTDQQIREAAQKDGLVGLCAFPGFINDKPKPTVDDLMKHLDHLIDVAGIDHVGLGVDFYYGTDWQANIDMGIWTRTDWAAPPWHYPLDGTNSVDLIAAMLRRGYTDEDVRKVVGANFQRVIGEVWA